MNEQGTAAAAAVLDIDVKNVFYVFL